MSHSHEELSHWITLLESAGSDLLPTPSLDKLVSFLYTELAKTPAARKKRDQILRENMFAIPANSTWERASVISHQARRIHCGMRSGYSWITRADRVKPLPETQRQIFRILTSG